MGGRESSKLNLFRCHTLIYSRGFSIRILKLVPVAMKNFCVVFIVCVITDVLKKLNLPEVSIRVTKRKILLARFTNDVIEESIKH